MKRPRRQNAQSALAWLKENIPYLFCDPPVPLPLGVHKLIFAAKDKADGEPPSNRQLRKVLYWWTHRAEYHQAISRSPARYGGQPITDEERQAARALLRSMNGRKKRKNS